MNSIRRMIMTGTIAFVITVNSGIWSGTASADLLLDVDEAEAQKILSTSHDVINEDLHLVLGFDSEDELNKAIFQHQSLAEIAQIQQVDVQKVIDLQAAQLMTQIDERLAIGQLTLREYGTLTAEIPEIIRNSVYGGTS